MNDMKPSYLTDAEFEAVRKAAARIAAALGISNDEAVSDLLTAIRYNSWRVLDNMGISTIGTSSRIVDAIVASVFA